MTSSPTGSRSARSRKKDECLRGAFFSYEACYFPGLGHYILRQTIFKYGDHPFHIYAIAVLAGKEEAAKWKCSLTLSESINTLPSDVATILSESAPDYLDRLRHLHQDRKQSLEHLKRAFVSGEPMKNRKEQFTHCRVAPSQKCVAYVDHNGDFPALRKRAAEVAFECVSKADDIVIGRLSMNRSMKPMIVTMV